MHKEKKDILTSKGKKEVDRDDVMQDGDAEAGGRSTCRANQ